MHPIKFFTLFIFTIGITFFWGEPINGTSFVETINQSYTSEVQYKSPSQNDLETGQKLFYELFMSSDFKIDHKAWSSLGFEVERMASFLILKEKKEDYKGRGIYVFNTSKPSSIILEAPHRPSDRYTDSIVMSLMEEGPFLAAAWNTVYRKTVNFTRAPMSYFNAFTEAFGKAYPTGIVLQFHGFNSKAHDLKTDLILSATLSSPPPLFYVYGNALKQLPFKTSFYPEEVKVLGGTKNINAEKFRSSASDGLFLHMEMSLNLRKSLSENKDLREMLIKCFEKKAF